MSEITLIKTLPGTREYTELIDLSKNLSPQKDGETPEGFLKATNAALNLPAPFGNYVLLKDGAIIGTCKLFPDQEKIGEKYNINGTWITFVIIFHKWRGQGYGRILLEQIVTLVQSHNISKLNLMVSNENKIAGHLYKNFGFKVSLSLEDNIEVMSLILQ